MLVSFPSKPVLHYLLNLLWLIDNLKHHNPSGVVRWLLERGVWWKVQLFRYRHCHLPQISQK